MPGFIVIRIADVESDPVVRAGLACRVSSYILYRERRVDAHIVDAHIVDPKIEPVVVFVFVNIQIRIPFELQEHVVRLARHDLDVAGRKILADRVGDRGFAGAARCGFLIDVAHVLLTRGLRDAEVAAKLVVVAARVFSVGVLGVGDGFAFCVAIGRRLRAVLVAPTPVLVLAIEVVVALLGRLGRADQGALVVPGGTDEIVRSALVDDVGVVELNTLDHVRAAVISAALFGDAAVEAGLRLLAPLGLLVGRSAVPHGRFVDLIQKIGVAVVAVADVFVLVPLKG